MYLLGFALFGIKRDLDEVQVEIETAHALIVLEVPEDAVLESDSPRLPGSEKTGQL